MRRTGATAKPARAPKEPRRFADEEDYTTERPPSVLRRMLHLRAQSEQADDDDSQPGAMTGKEFVARETQAAEAAGISSKRADAPIYDPDEPKKVTLPSGWKPSSKKEVEKYFERLTHDERYPVLKLHYHAFFAGGTSGFGKMGLDAAVNFIRAYGLVVGPWHKHGFPGMCNSDALAQQRRMKLAQESNERRSRDATFDRLAGMGLPKGEQTHDASYREHEKDDVVAKAFVLGEDVPRGVDREQKIKEWFPPTVATCIDCRRRRRLVKIEHAKGGEHDGERRKPPCHADNVGERAAFDAYADALYLIGEKPTPEGYQGVLDVRLAYAGRPGASTEDKKFLAMGRRAAAEATVEDDRVALRFGSSLRGRRIRNELGPTLEQARETFRKKEAARKAALYEREAAAAAHSSALPPVTAGMRVVVIDEKSRYHGRSGVVQGFRGHVHIAVLLAGDASDRCFYRRALRIETPRKPSARKPAARKPAAKPAARKPSVRKASKKSRK